VVFYFGTGAIGELVGPGVLTVIRLLGLVALPAIIATHTVTGSFSRALNPLATAAMIVRLGWGYVLVVGVAVGAGLLGRAIVLEGDELASLLRIALLMLLWLAMFSVLGGVLHARRYEVGFEPEYSPERRQRRHDRDRDRERDLLVDQVFAEFRAGRQQTAWQTIEQHVTRSPTPVTEYAWILERVATWPNPRLANRVAQALLPLLLAAQRNGDALKVVRARLKRTPSSGRSRANTSSSSPNSHATAATAPQPARYFAILIVASPTTPPATAPTASPNNSHANRDCRDAT
jgi:hypothetical protein